MSKMKYYKQAETLFLQDGLSVDEICKMLNVPRRTIFYWREKYDWDRKRAEKLATKENFSEELQSFAEKLMAKITTDMNNKKPVNQSEFYTLTNLLKYLPDVAKFKLKQQSQTPKPTDQLSEDFIKQIEKEFFGIE
ncbi:helix-turn-helix domain-containing protein [bacterium]|nr:helix-turn-helix domain-containing protein [bacterium]MBQ9149609.1 helix-turn-helix domain-containing protein [bacterium]